MKRAKSIFLALTLILVSLSGGVLLGQHTTNSNSDLGKETEKFYGNHQSGIATPQQANLTLIAFDLKRDVDASALARLLRLWSNDSANLTQGKEVIGAVNPGMEENPARVTVTFGFGYSLFKKLALKWPLPETSIPSFPKIDKLQERWSDGDLVVQIAGDDPLAIFNLGAVLKKDAEPFAKVRWQQRGFLNSAGVNTGKVGRNLLGQFDGTANPPLNSKDFNERVWRDDGSTVMVIRRIELAIENWDRLSTNRKGEATGRRIVGGAKLKSLPPQSHVGRSFTENNQGIFRRGFNYDDGYFENGNRNAGLIFISFQDSLERFTKIQSKLAQIDQLNTWTKPIGSALFYIPSGISKNNWILRSFLE